MTLSDFIEELNIAIQQDGHDIYCNAFTAKIVKRCLTKKNMFPAADVVPVVHAYWRDTGSGQECSACKEIQYGYDTGRYFCANCGAKMDGEE